MTSQKLPSEAPLVAGRQDSQSPEQSVARREALAHLFDDDNTNVQDQDQTVPVPSVELRTALPLPNLFESVPLEHRQAPASKSKSRNITPAAERARPDSVPRRNTRVEQPTPTSHGSLSNAPSNAPSVQPNEQPAATYDMANANNFIPTNQHRNMRACMVCSIVKTEQQFRSFGCPNCDGFLQLRGNSDGIADCTSQVFEGLITVSDTSKSWVARWQRLEGYVAGVYAVQVEGILPEEFIAAAEENGVHYIPRDGSVNEALPTDA
ncbi:transcription elongation factor spt4 [Didymosphaeria variabile]|uniref:Transcription elongation factor SPT4 n=1 Tax=Didymosphaeria variabile TaxID=1932322 RepID=A0A9W8XFE1_9PLEO|nr:transcription elongation factor spt4 [Didymosphaeria variabile]KAJ4348815.1 transcription elongation factor spt4 [Didymosphaeria variabile]